MAAAPSLRRGLSDEGRALLSIGLKPHAGGGDATRSAIAAAAATTVTANSAATAATTVTNPASAPAVPLRQRTVEKSQRLAAALAERAWAPATPAVPLGKLLAARASIKENESWLATTASRSWIKHYQRNLVRHRKSTRTAAGGLLNAMLKTMAEHTPVLADMAGIQWIIRVFKRTVPLLNRAVTGWSQDQILSAAFRSLDLAAGACIKLRLSDDPHEALRMCDAVLRVCSALPAFASVVVSLKVRLIAQTLGRRAAMRFLHKLTREFQTITARLTQARLHLKFVGDADTALWLAQILLAEGVRKARPLVLKATRAVTTAKRSLTTGGPPQPMGTTSEVVWSFVVPFLRKKRFSYDEDIGEHMDMRASLAATNYTLSNVVPAVWPMNMHSVSTARTRLLEDRLKNFVYPSKAQEQKWWEDWAPQMVARRMVCIRPCGHYCTIPTNRSLLCCRCAVAQPRQGQNTTRRYADGRRWVSAHVGWAACQWCKNMCKYGLARIPRPPAYSR